MLNRKNIWAKHQCKKLEDKMYWPFKLIATGRNARYCTAKFPKSEKIHPTFIISLLEKYLGTNPKKQVVQVEADTAEWKMESIIASGPSDDDQRNHV